MLAARAARVGAAVGRCGVGHGRRPRRNRRRDRRRRSRAAQPRAQRNHARRTDAAGRFALLSVPPGEYALRVSANGFTPSVSNLRLLVGQALEIPVALALGGPDGQRRGQRRGAADRGAPDAGRAHGPARGDRHAAAQRPQLPGSGPAGSRGVAHGPAQHRAVRRDVGGARHGHLHQRPAQPEQHVRGGRPVGQRRRRGAGRHLLRPGRDPRVPGDHLRRARRSSAAPRRAW